MARVTQHAFTATILKILNIKFGEYAEDIFNSSELISYINQKTRSANSGSKSRGSFANHYALYVVIEDYIKHGFSASNSIKNYSEYEGARFTDLFKRQRELPFGSKLQNLALNARLNDEFEKYHPTIGRTPIVRDVATQRYWIQEDLLLVKIRHKDGNDVDVNRAMFEGYNVATVFGLKKTVPMPEFYMDTPVFNGDESDLRFLDPKGVVVGLYAKGKAKKDTSGFVKYVPNGPSAFSKFMPIPKFPTIMMTMAA